MEKRIPPPKSPTPKVPEKPLEKKPSFFEGKKWVETKIISKELKKDEYYKKLDLPREKREKIGSILADKKIFGDLIEKSGKDYLKLQSLIKELKNPGTSLHPEIKEIAKKVRQEIGEAKTKKIADILKEKFGL